MHPAPELRGVGVATENDLTLVNRPKVLRIGRHDIRAGKFEAVRVEPEPVEPEPVVAAVVKGRRG